MANLFVHNAEGYGAAGVTITTANSASGSGSAFTTVTTTGSSTVTSSATSAHGTYGIQFDPIAPASQRCYVRCDAGLTQTTGGVRFNFRRAAFPGVTYTVAILEDASYAPVAYVKLNSTGHLIIADAAQTTQATGAGTALATGAYLRIEVDYTAGTTTGAITVRHYNTVDSGGAATDTVTATNINTGTGFRYLRVGNCADNNAGASFADDIVIGSTAAIGPYSGGETVSGSATVIPDLLLVNNTEGLTNGTTVTTANSGGASGNAWTSIQKSASTTVTSSTTAPAHGGSHYLVNTNASAGRGELLWDLGASYTLFGARAYFRKTVSWPTSAIVMRGYDEAGASCVDVQVNTSGFVVLRNAALGTVATGAVNVGTSAYFRLELNYTPATCSVKVFTTMDSTTAAETVSGSSAFGTELRSIGFGNGSTNNMGILYVDDMAVSASQNIGPYQTGETGTSSTGGGEVVTEDAYYRRWIYTSAGFVKAL